MNVSLNNNTLTVVLPITAATAANKSVALTSKDDKGNEVYRVSVNKDGKGSISNFGITCNSVIDGKLAFIQVLPADMTMEQVKETYGEALLAAQTYVDSIATVAATKTAAIDALFVTE